MCARKRAKTKRAGSHRTKRTRSAPSRASNAQQFKGLLEWLLPRKRIFAGLGLHGNTKWAPTALIGLALCWGWAESINVTDAFVTALDQCRQLGLMPLTTYQGFMNALVRWTDPLLALLWPVLHEHMHQIGGKFWQVGEWVPIAFDGSRGSAPRSEANEKALCAPNYGKGTTAKYRKKKSKGMRRRKNEKNKPQPQEPQAWITLLWHMGLRLPWMWRLGPSNSSERRHVSEMLAEADLPKNTLFCGDAGFIGYPLWAQILSHGYHFLVTYCQMLCCKIVSGGVLHDPVNEEFSLEERNDVLVTVEAAPAFLGGVSQFEHHGQARSSCAASLRAAVA